MAKWKIRWESGEEEEEYFDTPEAANDMANYYQACAEEGAETDYLSNPGDHPYDEGSYKRPEYEIVEVNE